MSIRNQLQQLNEHHLGDLYVRLGQPEQARQIWIEGIGTAKKISHPLSLALNEQIQIK